MIAKRLLGIQKESSPPAPAATDVYYDYRSLILNMQGPAGSTTFTDDSPNNFTVSPYGNAQLASDATFGTVASFDGSGDYLSIASNPAFNFGTGDFTVEFWYYYNGTPQKAARIFQTRNGDLYSGVSITHKFINNNQSLAFAFSTTGSTWTYNTNESSTIEADANAWTHFAIVRNGNVLYCYKNGVQNTVFASFTGSLYYNASDVPVIGGQAGTSRSINGLIGPLRISPWAVYTANFTPSQELFPAVQDSTYANPYYDKVALQLKFDGTNGSTSFVDTGPNAFTVTPYGNAQITSASKYGSGAGAFDGSGDYLDTPNTTALDLPGDFTIEAWFYGIGLTTTSGTIIGKWQNPVAWALLVATDKIQLGTGNNGGFSATYSFLTTIANGVWNHVAISRSGTSIKCFLNGNQVGSTITSSVNLSATSTTDIGRLKSTNSNYFNGYLDDLRITKGVARYTANFTPPVRGLSTIYNPYSTLPVSGAALWLDGADSSTLFTDAGVTPVSVAGDLVYQWSDKSGNNRHAIQTTSANRPTWVPPASGQNGFGAVGFNGTSGFLIIPSLTINGNFTFVFAIKSSAPGLIYEHSANANTNNGSYLYSSIGNSSKIGRNSLKSSKNATTNWLANGDSNFVVQRTRGTHATHEINKNGTWLSLSTAAGEASDIGTSTVTDTLYFASRAGTSVFSSQALYECILFNRDLSDAEVSELYTYIKAKWGTP